MFLSDIYAYINVVERSSDISNVFNYQIIIRPAEIYPLITWDTWGQMVLCNAEIDWPIYATKIVTFIFRSFEEYVYFCCKNIAWEILDSPIRWSDVNPLLCQYKRQWQPSRQLFIPKLDKDILLMNLCAEILWNYLYIIDTSFLRINEIYVCACPKENQIKQHNDYEQNNYKAFFNF